MNPLRILECPEYFLRPRQIWRRLRRKSLLANHRLRLAWELPVELDMASHIGVDLANHGIYDRVVPEAIWRLLDPGERAIDVGANLGYISSLMALKLGPGGRVFAFEPAPRSARLLAKNVALWAAYDLSPITVVRRGLSDHTGTATMHESADLGGFSLEERPPGLAQVRPPGCGRIDIEVTTLDAFAAAADDAALGLVKIDVEGHELQVLAGGRRLLERKRVRDIVYEDFHPHPTPVAPLLEAAGYTVFALFAAWHRPVLLPLRDAAARRHGELAEPPNFLATSDPDRAVARFKAAGWNCLRRKARPQSQPRPAVS
jgi:FkbM family methyltransferase